ncbi:MAG: hypothetical protein H7068_07170 [Pedobacter sp.]|nr:hypothetical protein [Chitinophagaceae bacterium]
MINSSNTFLKKALPFVYLFIILNTIFLLFGKKLDAIKIDHVVVIGANILLFLISIITLIMHLKAVKNSNPNVFSRSIMGGMIIKLFGLGAAVVIYLIQAGKDMSVYAIFVSMFLYVLYTFLEVKIALQLNQKPNANN